MTHPGAHGGGSGDDTAAFLSVATPDAWVEAALTNRDTLLIDHANCEKKAAGTALSLLYRYVDKPDLLRTLSPIAREELLHFEQVHETMQNLGIRYRHLSAGRYAAVLRSKVAAHEPDRLVETLIVGAIIEARSCERMAKLAERMDHELGSFYARLHASEARHFRVYLDLANSYASEAPGTQSIDVAIEAFLEVESELILAPDAAFRFHSGPPESVPLR